MSQYHSKPEERTILKITLFEPIFREFGKTLDNLFNAVMKTFQELPEEQRKKILEELSKK